MGKGPGKNYSGKTKKQLVQELQELHKRVAAFDRSNGNGNQKKVDLQQRKRVKTAAIEDMPDGVIFVNMDGKVIYVNKTVEKLLGFKADELVGKAVLELPTYRSPRDKKKAGDAFKELLEKGITEHIDIGAVNKEGKEIAISFAASVIRDAHDNPKTLVAVMRDITKRKRAEDALKEREENFRALIDNFRKDSRLQPGGLNRK